MNFIRTHGEDGQPLQRTQTSSCVHVTDRTDAYFTKTRAIVERFGDKQVTYGVFLRADVICAIQPALDLLNEFYPSDAAYPLVINRRIAEGADVADQQVMFTYSGSMSDLAELETLVLRRVGIACHSAANAYRMCMSMPKVAFMDMHARHSPGDDFSDLASYGAGIGSSRAKMNGCIGFIGTSQRRTARFYGTADGMGTMPHALIGYAGSTLEAVKMFEATFPTENITALVDYFGCESTDATCVVGWWNAKIDAERNGRTLSMRLDTHGGRYAEGLDYESSIRTVCDWLHVRGEYEAVRAVIGTDAYELASNELKDKIRKLLFGTGVSVANVIKMRTTLDLSGGQAVKIVGSSGFNPFKCKIFAQARAPLDIVGTGSFIPDSMSSTYATADIFKYGEIFSVKVGRESLFEGL